MSRHISLKARHKAINSKYISVRDILVPNFVPKKHRSKSIDLAILPPQGPNFVYDSPAENNTEEDKRASDRKEKLTPKKLNTFFIKVDITHIKSMVST